MSTRLLIAGAAGRMGLRITDLALQDRDFEVVYGLTLAGEKGDKRISSGADESHLEKADVVIDFTSPASTVQLARKMAALKKPYVIGTTGLNPDEEREVESLASQIPILKSPNMSLGVNVFFKIARETAKALKSYSVEIIETHHVHKKDAPSGTALQAGRYIEQAGGQKVRYQSLREGEVVGDHRIVFTGPADRLEIFHHADSRDTFAAGSLQAAKWLIRQRPGLYSMQNVLGL